MQNTFSLPNHTTYIHLLQKGTAMIAAEMKNSVSTIRIHDECYVKEPHGYMEQLNQIVANSYKRRVALQASSTHCQPDNVDSPS